jgi:hypothetical protein
MKRLAVMLPVLFILANCAGTGGGSVSSKVAAAVVSLTTAERLALIYTSQPRCTVAPPPCSDPATVQRIKDADNQAYAAVKAAEQNEAMLGSALTAIKNLQSVIPVR